MMLLNVVKIFSDNRAWLARVLVSIHLFWAPVCIMRDTKKAKYLLMIIGLEIRIETGRNISHILKFRRESDSYFNFLFAGWLMGTLILSLLHISTAASCLRCSWHCQAMTFQCQWATLHSASAIIFVLSICLRQREVENIILDVTSKNYEEERWCIDRQLQWKIQ